MKKFLLLGIGLLTAGAMNAQVIFSGISPTSIQGNYDLTYSEPGGGSEWNSPDLEIPSNSIQDTLVAYETDTLGCIAATNSGEINGHIAVLYRGDCQFGEKALNAQQAGAIACVIINNEPGGPVGMAGGNSGSSVTIPVVMISDVDGAALMAEMESGPVEVFIGNKLGFFDDDLGMKAPQILRPQYSSVPSSIATDGTEFQVDLEAYAFNFGANDQVNVTVQAIIEFDGNEIYNETASPDEINSGDSALFTLPEFSPAAWAEGYYNLTYIVQSDAPEEYAFDNEIESDFVISGSDFSYASIDETTLTPNTSGGIRAAESDDFSFCVNFKDANASRLAPQSISFSAIKGSEAPNESLEGEELFVKVLKWEDDFQNLNDMPNPVVYYTEIMTEVYQYQTDASGETVTAEFTENEIVVLEDDQRYLFCVSTPNEHVYIGSDPDRDYTYNFEYYNQPLFPVEGGNINPNGFGPNSVPGIAVSFINADEVSLKNEKMAIEMNVYPSPASDILNVDFNQNKVNKVELINTMGQTVAVEEVTNNAETTTIDVASVENGVYIVKVYLANNMTHTMQVVVNH